MALTNAFYETVESGNVRRVRIMMKNSLLVDTTFAEFDAMEKAASKMAGLYDEHDGKELIEDRNLWNDDYMDKVMVELLSNFSHERIEHIKNVVRYLRPAARETAPKSQGTDDRRSCDNAHKESYQEEKRRSQQNDDNTYVKIGIGAVLGAVAGGAIASFAAASLGGIIGAAAAGTVVGGAAAAVVVTGAK